MTHASGKTEPGGGSAAAYCLEQIPERPWRGTIEGDDGCGGGVPASLRLQQCGINDLWADSADMSLSKTTLNPWRKVEPT
jgi:hypothetical protein